MSLLTILMENLRGSLILGVSQGLAPRNDLMSGVVRVFVYPSLPYVQRLLRDADGR